MSQPSFLKHALIYGLGNVLTQAVGFLLLPLYLRYLSPQEYGTLEVLNRFSDVLVICLLGRGFRQATLTFFRQADCEEERQVVACTAITVFAACALAGAGLIVMSARPISRAAQIDQPWLLEVAVVAALLDALTSIPLALLQARVESGLFVAATFLQLFSRVTFCIALVAGLGWGVTGVLYASLSTSFVFAAALCARELARGLRFDAAKFGEMIRFTLPFLPGGLCMFVMDFGDRFFLINYCSKTDIGVYSLGYKLAMAVTMMSVTPLYMVWCVRMYDAAQSSDAPRIFGTTFTHILGAYVAAGLGVCLFQDEIIEVLGGARYAGAGAVIAPVTLAYGLLAAACQMDSGFFIRRRTGGKAWISLATATVMLALYATLIRSFGVTGAALATLGGFAFHAGLTYYVSKRIFPVAYEWGRLGAILGLAVALWAASRGMPVGGWFILAKASLWATWLAGLWGFGLVRDEEKASVRSAVRSAKSVLSSTCAVLSPPRSVR